MAVLAFASFTNPGGGYIQGYLGQEATLCADSYLYNVLDKQRKWYGENRRRNINCELYRNRALVVPAVRFDRNHVHAYADVIVAAAPNVKRARQEYRVSDDALLDAARPHSLCACHLRRARSREARAGRLGLRQQRL